MAIYTVLKVLHNFKVKTAHEARDNQFLFQNVQNETFEIFKMFKNKMTFTRAVFALTQNIATRKTALHSWHSYVVTNVCNYHAVITEGL